MICPKCGFEQPDGSTDCARCGVVFSRYRANGAAGANGTILPVEPLPQETPYGGPLPPPTPPAAQLYGDPLPPPSGLPDLHAGRSFELGPVLSETLQTYFANFLPFTLLAAVAYAPVLAYELLVTTQTVAPQPMQQFLVVTVLLQLLCWPLATATVTFGVFQQMRGREAAISECLKVGLSNLFTVLGVALLEVCAIVAGSFLCGIGALIATATFAVSVPVAIEERPGVFAALNRSGELTRGFRWRIFCVLFLLGIVGGGVGLVFGVVAFAFASVPVLSFLLREIPGIIASGLSATAAAVIYYRLRSVKESVDIENIASVFD